MLDTKSNKQHEHFMSLALKEAKKGFGNTKPNPLVGAVIVKDGVVVSKSYHKEYGKNHAEVNALEKLNYNAKDCSIYVNLEPCAHYGKTPPCVDSIIKSGIKEVIIPFKDPSTKVDGKGIEKLKANNIKVVSSVLVKESFELNEDFIYHSTTGKPLVTLKWASSIDGKLSNFPNKRKQLTNELTNEQVHILRACNHAILVGYNTIKVDNPLLSIRSKTVSCNRINPKIIIANANNIETNFQVFKPNNNVIIITPKLTNKEIVKKLEDKDVKVIEVNTDNNNNITPSKIINALGKIGITSLIVEGGAFVISSFLSSNVVDKIECFVAPLILGGNINITNFNVKEFEEYGKFSLKNLTSYGNDIHVSFENQVYEKWKKEKVACLQE